jgi:hypothetical protein
MPETQPIPEAPRKRADAATYERVFVTNPDGSLVLEDLCARFHDRPIFVRGGVEAQRETERRAAEQGVIRFILGRIGQLPEAVAEDDKGA